MEWSRQLREQQSQKTEQIRKETDRIKAVADAERERAVLLVRSIHPILLDCLISHINQLIKHLKMDTITNLP